VELVETLIRDAYGRPLESLRLLVTAECNYRCFFCHLEGDPLGAPARPGFKPPVMTPEDYSIVAEAAWMIGIRGFKVTGGEPLIRMDIVDIIGALASSAPGSDISMTTNGMLLEALAQRLADAGLRRVNVSIHSLRRDRYRFITGVDGLDRAIRGVRAAVDAGLRVKVNALILKGVNEDEVFDLIEFSRSVGATLQLIELIPVGMGAKLLKTHRFPLSLVEEKLKEMGASVEVRSLHNRPVYRLPNGAVVEIVKPYSNPVFCSGCNRLRLDSSGKLSPCINWRGERVDLLSRIRGAKSREEAVVEAAKALIEANWLRRPFHLYGIGYNGAPAPKSSSRVAIPKKSDSLKALQLLSERRHSM
jgi:cyclic pyranopterin phosphate synthase